ncbi:hypothetical protein Tco_0214921 [Tanacetum coccineum]
MWSFDHLSVSVPSRGLYKTKPPSPRVIKSLIKIPRQGQETRTKNKKTIVVGENEILTREIQTHMKPWVDIISENVICLVGHMDHVFACLCHMLYCIETSTPYNLAFFILKRIEKTRFKPKEPLPYGMLLTRLFKHVVSVSPELAFDHYLLHDRAMHPLAPHYERKTRADQGKKRPRESNASSSASTLNHPSSSHPLDDSIEENDDESFHPNPSSPSQNISSSSNNVSRVHQNPPHESHYLNTYLSETINRQTQQRDAHREGLRTTYYSERPRPTSTRSLLTLKPLPKINPKDKGKKKIKEEDESDTESEDIPEAEKKIGNKEERKRLAEEEATKTTLSDEYDFIQARIEADRLLALRLQDEERGQFTIKERSKFLHDTIATQRRFLAEQRAIAIRNKPPTRTQLRNQMMTYLKHVGNKKHSDLKSKTFEEIQALYEKVKRFDESFTAVGSTKDERRIKEMNEGVKDTDQKRLKEEDTAKVPAKVEVTEQGTKKRKGGHIKMIARKKPRKQLDVDSDDEHRKCLRMVTFEGTIDSEIMEKKSFIARLDKVSSLDRDYLVIYRANGNFRAFNYLMEVLHIFDRQDLYHLYNLMLEQYSETTLEGIELILWGDLKIMMESSTEENDQSDFWSNQQDWKIVTWRLYEACGVCILEFEDGTVIHMLVERRYPFSKELLQRMLDLGLEVERR